MQRTGRCLCGEISFSAQISGEIGACHCLQCQRWTGGGPLVVSDVWDLVIDGAETANVYHASQWGERGFCKTCGTNLFWRMQGSTISSLAVGLLDDQSDLRMTKEIFVDYRPSWMQPWPGAAQSTEAEEIAKFKAYQEGESS